MSPDRRDVEVRIHNRFRQRAVRTGQNVSHQLRVEQGQRSAWWQVQIRRMAVLAGEFPGREVDARVTAWTQLAADLRSGRVVLDGVDDNDDTELLGEYAEWLAQRLPSEENALYDWAIEELPARSPAPATPERSPSAAGAAVEPESLPRPAESPAPAPSPPLQTCNR
jgi:hypothetical protein